LEPEKQREWLERALLAPSMSVTEFKLAIKRQEPKTQDRDTTRGAIVRLADTDLKLIEKLAAEHKMKPGEFIREIIIQYLKKPETLEAVKNAELQAKLRAAQNRSKGREKWEAEMTRSINALLVDYEDDPLDPKDFVATWERLNGKKFPFDFAMRHTEFAAHYHGISKEDAGCGQFSEFEEHGEEYEASESVR
jgi:hypothetical protein